MKRGNWKSRKAYKQDVARCSGVRISFNARSAGRRKELDTGLMGAIAAAIGHRRLQQGRNE